MSDGKKKRALHSAHHRHGVKRSIELEKRNRGGKGRPSKRSTADMKQLKHSKLKDFHTDDIDE